MEPALRNQLLSRSATGLSVAILIGTCAIAGYALGAGVAPSTSSRMLPWIIARATGIGAFLALTAIVLMGLFFRRPVRAGTAVQRETVLRFHVFLWPALAGLLGAHIGSLLADRYAGVPWRALVIPGAATYRPGAVTYGLAALYLLVLVTASALLAGRAVVRSRWAGLHRLAYPAFGLTWVHGVLAGSDTSALRWLYVLAGMAVIGGSLYAASRRPLRPGGTGPTGGADAPGERRGMAMPVSQGPGDHGPLRSGPKVQAGR